MRRGATRIRLSKGMLAFWLILTLAIGIGVGIGVGYAAKGSSETDSTAEITAYKARISELEGKTSQLNEQIAALNSAQQETDSAYEALQTEYEKVSSELAALKRNYSLLDSQKRALTQEYQELEETYTALQEACADPTVEKLVQLSERVAALENEKAWLETQKAALEKQITPSPDRALPRSQVFYNEEFKSLQWKGRDYELQLEIERIGRLYNSEHVYLPGQFDCNDMAIDIWNMLRARGIVSVIVVGNKEKPNASFEEAVHAWLYVFNGNGEVIYLEPTTGEVIYGKLADGSPNPKAAPYWSGFIYRNPSDLRKDLKNWW